eukprot:CAMPEP_0198322274 /NCGR_PEP_ID=MMETSP1450-20131203/10790_1 /TAXON_ID=753684 ORGANISM="Madagascaria erythrocladiodes, Strain CCMP3234" /NCGR_SAMPLE_ID=MMETSP1450 /ASSEMBLY_ACC=CAM_ASM_001115 /LENGTH=132 /DNA_ID=CAMNT_0044025883 /DNA_START=56 /DNA_END=451 /DNA_ORIENTATION=+
MTTTTASRKLVHELYATQREIWPRSGRHILAQYDDGDYPYVVVYMAFAKGIGEYAAKHKKFSGAPGWRDGRMSWFKTNFLWMMYRSSWGTAKNQECTLALFVRRANFVKLLSAAVPSSPNDNYESKEAWQAA